MDGVWNRPNVEIRPGGDGVQPFEAGRERVARDAAPEIRVTIGRIEIVTEAPPEAERLAAPAPAAAEPVASLEDYLTARNRGQL